MSDARANKPHIGTYFCGIDVRILFRISSMKVLSIQPPFFAGNAVHYIVIPIIGYYFRGITTDDVRICHT